MSFAFEDRLRAAVLSSLPSVSIARQFGINISTVRPMRRSLFKSLEWRGGNVGATENVNTN
jgi:hypothetical protein